ncbi:hypothetical protein [Magnetospirillum gryphiswaldense]|uniref:Uncharacterized protein n=1 Tax=Magnetospirillum gryphiswaldense TaxID=55518 RepID=A4TYY8_9PROT|nr:hypothetical protein [Magnetospirillum gryphiswaldense]AVM74194.1 hypothetical protein MSR1_17020 [Magnetospirillum gryphiswaldense MSR-1]AVM78097.1 hypothetical protein MSR1L_17020 [Magnetospirillum gryphiswaldense]CAM75845.1 hypothetical protein MGR_0461 [Magnetospirillum gryphiswaldense MSR-1]
MTIPYRSQYRNPLRRHLTIGLSRTVRLLSRPLVQLGVAALVTLVATLWLHQHTPEQGGGTVDLRASGGYVQSYKAS